MNENIKVVDLTHLSNQLVKAAREFVDLKYRVDTEGQRSPANIPADLHGPMSGGEWGPYFGLDFFTNIIPFLPQGFSSQKNTIMAVPMAHTLGCSWRLWPDPNISLTDKEDVISYINSANGIQDTSYYYVPELGLFFAGEGKNRVNFCRFHNIEYIPAKVYVKHYPDAERIKVYVLGIGGGRDVWAILDNQYVQKVSHYAYALPLLRAYGVTVLREWPADLPALYVLLQNERYCFEDVIFHRKVIDICAVREVLDNAIEKAELAELAELAEQYERCCVLDLPVRKKFIYLSWMLLVWLVAVVVWGYSGEGVVGDISFAILAFTSGILALMMIPVLQARRRHL